MYTLVLLVNFYKIFDMSPDFTKDVPMASNSWNNIFGLRSNSVGLKTS